jgi:neutral trehalase
MTELQRITPSGDLPQLPEYWAPPEDPRNYAAPTSPEWQQLCADVGGDGLPLALAPLLNGHTRLDVGKEWMSMRPMLPQDMIPEAAGKHFDTYLDRSGARAHVPAGVPGQSPLDYARFVLYDVLRRPARPADTDLHLRTAHDYFVPGTRFVDRFPADDALVTWALLADGYVDMGNKNIANTQHDTARFGFSPNLSRIGMLREQTRLDSFNIESTTGLYGSEALTHWRDALIRNIEFKQRGKAVLDRQLPHVAAAKGRMVRLPGGLVRGYDKGIHAYRAWDDTEVDYKQGTVIRVESVPEEREVLQRMMHGVRDQDERAAIWRRGNKNLAAMAETFQDMTDEFLADRRHLETAHTTDICASWQQAAVAHQLKAIARASEELGDLRTAEKYWKQYNELRDLMPIMWRQTGPNTGHYTDWNWREGAKTGALNAAQILPLLVGGDFVPYENALMTINLFREKLFGQNGLMTSDIFTCPEQWSGKRDWPSLAMLAIHAAMTQAVLARQHGLDPEPFIQFAEDVQELLLRGLDAWHGVHQTFPERISDDNPTEVAVGGEYTKPGKNGETPKPQIGFGMTVGSYIVARTFNLRELFSNMEPHHGSWLRQAFAIHIGRSALVLAA